MALRQRPIQYPRRWDGTDQAHRFTMSEAMARAAAAVRRFGEALAAGMVESREGPRGRRY